MEKHGIRRSIGVLILVGILPLTGCLVYSSDVSYGDKGKPLSDHTLHQIECGQTTRDWVIATFGEPSQQRTTKDGLEVLEYRYSRKKDNNFVLLPFVIINDEGEDKQTVFIEISDGVVKNYWQETSRD
jgi:hypothetical protein